MFYKIFCIAFFCYFPIMVVLFFFNALADQNTKSGRVVHVIYIGGMVLGIASITILCFIEIIKSVDLLPYLIAMLVCHQICTIYSYFDLKREDKGIYKDPPKVIEFLMYLPVFINALYDVSLGFVDNLRQKRLCNIIYDKDQEIAKLKIKEAELYDRISYECYLRENGTHYKLPFEAWRDLKDSDD